MAGHLAAAGHRVRVYNRTEATASRWLNENAAHSVEAFATPFEAATGAAAVLVCAGNDGDLREVVFGEKGALAAMKAGTCLIDHTTVSPELAREIFDAAQKVDVEFLDAPVSGGQAGAQNGALTIMVGGEEATYQRSIRWLDCYGKMHLRLGPAGSGQMTKAVNQICIAGLLQGLSEGLNVAKRAGLDGKRVVEVISQGAAGSWQMDNRHETMLDGEFDFGFAVDWMRKDLAIALGLAEEVGAEMPVTKIVNDYYAEVQKRGGGRLDTSSLITMLNRES